MTGELLLARLLVVTAGRLVPQRLRATWCEEWTSELIHANERLARRKSAGSARLLRFAAGAFADAWDLRISNDPALPVRQCLYVGLPLALLVAMGVPTHCYRQTRVAVSELTSASQVLMVYRSARIAGLSAPPSLEDFLRWQKETRRGHLGAFRIVGGTLRATPDYRAVLSVATAAKPRLMGLEFDRVEPMDAALVPQFVLARLNYGSTAEQLEAELTAPNGSAAVVVPVNAWIEAQVKTAGLVSGLVIGIALLLTLRSGGHFFLLRTSLCWQTFLTLLWFECSASPFDRQTVFPGALLFGYVVASGYTLAWEITETRKRCRVCARRLEAPVQIGSLAGTLLESPGVEWLCPSGHGALFTPDAAGSMTGAAVWVRYDASWGESSVQGGQA